MPWIGSAPSKTTQRSDGTRTGSAVFAEQKAANVKIRADIGDVHAQDLADMINETLRKDGGNFSADMDVQGQKFTNVDNATARTHFAAAGQVQDSAFNTATTAGNDTITATLSPAITAYAAGALFVLEAGGTNTTTATLNVNGVGAATIKKGKTGSLDLSAGDFAAGRIGLFAHDGTNVQMLNAPEFPSGTKLTFPQASAPTGWTKDTTHNDKALRVVSGTPSSGGSVAFSTAFASKTPSGTIGDTTLTTDQIPSHVHGLLIGPSDAGSGNLDFATSGGAVSMTTEAAGGGQSHTHTFSGNAINLAVSFVDVLIATKD